MPVQSPYTGPERKLVLAFHVGIAYSTISYMLLAPGREPEIMPVTRFPGSVLAGGWAKVPTVIYYDSAGVPRAIGAETNEEGFSILAEESQWIKAEWFPLHLRPRTHQTSQSNYEIVPSLPLGKNIVDVLADFLRYLYQSAAAYIENVDEEATTLLSGKVEFVMPHLNSWDGAQQSMMRDAAVRAGLITDSPEGRGRISFISEGEANLHHCTEKMFGDTLIQPGDSITIVDAGRGTIDVSTYSRKGKTNDEYQEIAPAQSYLKGSVFVTRTASKYITDLLLNTRFCDDVPSITDQFDKKAIFEFRSSEDPYYVKFSDVPDQDLNLGIRAGQLELDGGVVAMFFEPSIQCIIDAVKEQERLSLKRTSVVFLVGELATNDYLFTQIQERFPGLRVHRPFRHHGNATVREGALVRSHLTVRSQVVKCRILASKLIQPLMTKTLPEHVQGADAQIIVDFLNNVLERNDILQPRERKLTLHLLCKIAKSAQIFPKAIELTDVECDFSQPVNEGGFGVIFQGNFQGETVCIKAVQMYQAGAMKRALRAHAGELVLGCHVSHPNILPFYGAFISNEKRPRICITSPWMECGNLVDYLHEYPDTHRVPLVLDILSGLRYLHELEIVHGDLKASNVLISRTRRAILGDFGVSRIALTNVGSTTTADFAGTTNWMAPELLTAEDTPPATRNSDIWAFGCICYEILAGKIPFEGYKPAQLIRAFIRGGTIPLRPDSISGISYAEEIWSLAETCLHYDPSRRPTADAALKFVLGLNVEDGRPPVAADSELFIKRTGSSIESDYDVLASIIHRVQQSY